MRHVRSITAALLLVVPLTAGCAAGLTNATSSSRTTPYVANANLGALKVRAATIVPATSTANGALGYLTVVIVNSGQSPDQLTSATVGGNVVSPLDTTQGTDTTASPSPAELTIQPTHPLRIGDPELGATDLALAIVGSSSPLTVGTTLPVTFSFAQAGTLTLQVPVKDATDITG